MSNHEKQIYECICYLCDGTFITTKQKRRPHFCPDCKVSPLASVADLLYGQVKRARQAGLPATLTLEEWLSTLDFFGGKCAYCQELPYKCMDHFIPFELGGGTTKDNMAPACHGCNHRKGSRPPEERLTPDELERVRTYLYNRNW